jgi:hypothetical protein
MKETIDKELTREALAEHLMALADQLRKGGLTMDRRTWTDRTISVSKSRSKRKRDASPTAYPVSGRPSRITTRLRRMRWTSGNSP